MKRIQRWTTYGLTTMLLSGFALTPMTARASEEGHKNTATALGAAAIGLLLTQKNKTAGIIAGAGAIIAAKNREDAIAARHRREREQRNDWYGYDNRRQQNRWDDRRDNEYSYRNSRPNRSRFDNDDDCDDLRQNQRARYRRDDYRFDDDNDNFGRNSNGRRNNSRSIRR